MTTTNTANIIAKNVTEYRKSANLSQERLAEMASISVGYLSKIERALIENTSVVILIKIADALNVTVDDLIYEHINNKSSNINQQRLNQLLNEMDNDTSEQLSQSLITTITLLIKSESEH